MMSIFSGDLVPVWTAILGVGVFMYVLLDGFDLGVGILYGFVGDTGSRNLVIGSILATFSQGVVLGAFIQGFTTDGTAFMGGSFDCFTPFSVLTGISLLFGYALLGAGWLILKTEGELQATMRRLGRWALLLVLTAIFVVSLWTLAAHHAIAARWFGSLQGLWFAPVPLLSVCAAIWAWFAFAGTRSASPFLAGIALFVLAYVGMIISLWPMIVPYRLSLWQAASPPSTQAFLRRCSIARSRAVRDGPD
jgi:cytochrome d ubiquinol oxidase subunit II